MRESETPVQSLDANARSNPLGDVLPVIRSRVQGPCLMLAR
jgi:hypothetical protein